MLSVCPSLLSHGSLFYLNLNQLGMQGLLAGTNANVFCLNTACLSSNPVSVYKVGLYVSFESPQLVFKGKVSGLVDEQRYSKGTILQLLQSWYEMNVIDKPCNKYGMLHLFFNIITYIASFTLTSIIDWQPSMLTLSQLGPLYHH